MHPAFNATSVQLVSGREVRVEGIHITETYSGLLEGYPDEELNTETLANARTLMNGCWGARRTHMIAPTYSQDSGHTFLPPWLCIAWLSSPDPIDPSFMGSEMVVIWFAHDACSMPIKQMIHEAAKDLDWESLAEDFDY